ncbi:FtsX-like permease family protein [Cellulomonas endometrii]|uniref:FtsX-like permease family protein n=1 Tax=Cellulomonas endometrii TaxID=3036301 RepID=UPI0024ADC577|nr:FtsX-like permease family protein [Cellulomonas endometrii]
MTGRHRRRPASGARGPVSGLDLATLPRRAAAHAGPLALVAVLVAIATALGSAAPRAVTRVADDAVASAVERAGTRADVVVTAATGYEDTASATNPDAAADATTAASQLEAGLRARLGDVLAPPVAVTASVPLALSGPSTPGAAATGSTTVRLAWAHGAGDVRWTAGTAPQDEDDAVQVGLSEAVAEAVDAGPGSTLLVSDADGRTVTLAVSGVFRAPEPDDPRWTDLGDLLSPRTAVVGPATSTAVAALLSDASLPGALAALDPRTVVRTVRFAPLPARIGTTEARLALRELPAVQAAPAVLGYAAARASVHTDLDGTLAAALAAVDDARDATAGLVIGAATVTALLLALTAGLLARRRTDDLAARRTRGATLPALTVEHTVEAVVVAAAGGVAGVLLAHVVVPGPVVLAQVLPVAAVAAVALPVAVLHRARSAADPVPRREDDVGRAHGGRGGGGRGRGADAGGGGPRDGRGARRAAAELALVALAAGALVALRGREPGGAPDPLASAAPVTTAVGGALVVARLLPLALRRLAPVVRRARGAVPVLALARARSDGPGALPLLALATAAALVVVAASGAQQVGRDQQAAALGAVGADVLVHGAPDAGLAASADAWSRAAGVTAVVAGRVADDVPAVTEAGRTRVRLVAADPAALRHLAALIGDPSTGAGAAPEATGAGAVEVTWDGQGRTVHPLAGVGAPGWDAVAGAAGDRPVLVVDIAELGGAEQAAPDTVWLAGPGAAAAVRAQPADGEAEVVQRSAVLAGLASEVLPRALVVAGRLTAVLLLVLVGLAVLVSSARGGPGRRRALDTLRTVGLTDREAAAVAAGEVLPGVLVATLAGALVGAGVSAFVVGNGTGAAPEVAWAWAALPVTVGAAAALAVVAVEQVRGGTHRLGDVLRASG